MPTEIIEPATTTSTEGQRGATVTNSYVGREVMVYAVFETEVDSLSSLNAQATVFFSVGTGLLSFAAAIWINRAFYTDIPPAAQLATSVGAPILLALSVVFFGLAGHAWYSRSKIIRRVRSQTKPA
jgi:hypothetical protein